MSFASDAEADRRGMKYVAESQARFPHWLLFYSRHERGLVAFYRGECPRPGLIVTAPDQEMLVRRMAEEVQGLWQHASPHWERG
ncbi:hypothetical protein E1267_11380 [Nonomuraea longispora]|uniref:Uncharacterized protein n=1 Tax=Nonomuraea longispora TaxID=1848320 RepID=A0A4R4NKK1_9ACTN|nr:hypothetical protein E1267_11380 [Nonomuraea longispora]